MAILHIKAKPNARQNALLLAADGTITVRLKAPPQDGKANACLLEYLAQVLGQPKSNLELLTGHTAPFKKIAVAGLTDEQALAVLRQYASLS
ncbi:DUF167 domain-containing protein [Hymenobacter sp. DG25A]|uniref:DUF167 domain-containing protein n=1 Tax=Hymenobacter sp. DG25A TaxID=1385663 RepID=UPI0006BDED00|nr:DUF167 domain-containing protein [Hymenobacter sp. DG25A]ALD21615.1 hypothetical protein AM218_10855 [Hymenobacter sp. DG25A]